MRAVGGRGRCGQWRQLGVVWAVGAVRAVGAVWAVWAVGAGAVYRGGVGTGAGEDRGGGNQ